MNYKILLTSLLILGINPLSANAYCPQGNPRSTDYIRRKTPDRCEGIKVQPISGNSLSLISIATRNITDYGNKISLQVPRIKKVYVPVTLAKSSGKYEFVFYSQDRVRFNSLKIFPLEDKDQKNLIYNTSRKTASGEISFTWDGSKPDGSKAPGGRYKLHYIAFIDRINEPSDRIENVIVFEHHPNWLK